MGTEVGTMRVSLEVRGKTVEIGLKENGSVYDMLVAAQKKGLISFSGRQFSGVGFFVEEIDGLRQDGRKGMYWIYAVNGTKAHVGVSSYELKEGDRVTFTYEAAN